MAFHPPGMLRRLILLLQGSPVDEQESFLKKPRRSGRLQQRADHDVLKTPVQHNHHLPSPVTHLASETPTEFDKETTATPPQERPSQLARRRGEENHSQGLAFSSPPQDTQAFSQQDIDPNAPLVDGVDELKDGVWGYLLPLDTRFVRAPVVLKKKGACPLPTSSAETATTAKNGARGGRKTPGKEQGQKDCSPTAGGYIIGRHPECGEFPKQSDLLCGGTDPRRRQGG